MDESAAPALVCHVCVPPCASFANAAAFRSHLDEHLREKGLRTLVTCDTCGEAFKTKQEYAKHARDAHQLRPFACEHCTATFSQKGDLSRCAHVLRGAVECDIAYAPISDYGSF